LYYDTTENTTKIYSNATWNDLGGGWDGILPNYTTAQRNALSLIDGLIVYNTTDNTVQIYGSGVWTNIGGKLSSGIVCSLDGDCDSTHCVDGVCCNTSCNGGCEACNLTGTIGTCTIRTADDLTESPTACERCDGVNGTFQPQTANDGYLCTGKCNYCITGSCAVRTADDTTESPTACERCDGTNTTFQPQTANDGYLCSEKCNYCNVGICTVRAADDTTESPPVCQRCDGTNVAPVNVADNTQASGCTDTCKKCSSGNCVNQTSSEDLFNDCTATNCAVILNLRTDASCTTLCHGTQRNSGRCKESSAACAVGDITCGCSSIGLDSAGTDGRWQYVGYSAPDYFCQLRTGTCESAIHDSGSGGMVLWCSPHGQPGWTNCKCI